MRRISFFNRLMLAAATAAAYGRQLRVYKHQEGRKPDPQREAAAQAKRERRQARNLRVAAAGGLQMIGGNSA